MDGLVAESGRGQNTGKSMSGHLPGCGFTDGCKDSKDVPHSFRSVEIADIVRRRSHPRSLNCHHWRIGKNCKKGGGRASDSVTALILKTLLAMMLRYSLFQSTLEVTLRGGGTGRDTSVVTEACHLRASTEGIAWSGPQRQDVRYN